MPDYVFEKAIAQFIPSIGWPFNSIYETVAHTNWYRLIHPFSLSSFSSLQWKYGEYLIDSRLFDENTKSDLKLILLNQEVDVLPETGRDCQACRDSLKFHENYILKNGRLSEPVVFAASENLFVKIVDGNHRIAALSKLGLLGSYKIPAWFGSSDA